MMNNGINNIANSKVVVYPNGMVGVSKEFLNFIRATIGKAYQQMPATNFNQFNGQQMGYNQQSGAYNQQPGYNYNQPNGQQMGYNQQSGAYNQQQANYNTGYNQQQEYNYNQSDGQQMGYNQQPGVDNQKPRVNPERRIITPDDVKTITPNHVSLFLKDGVLVIPERIEKICSDSLLREKDIREIKIESKKIEIEDWALSSPSNIERIYAETKEICAKIYHSELHDRILQGKTNLFLEGNKLTLKDLDPELAEQLNFDTATTIDSRNEQVFLDRVEEGVLVIPENIKKIFGNCFRHLNNIKSVSIKSSILKIEKDCRGENYIFNSCGMLREIHAENVDVLSALLNENENLINKLESGEELHLFLGGNEVTWQELKAMVNQQKESNFDTATKIDSSNEHVFLDRIEEGVLVIPENIKKIYDRFCYENGDIEEVVIKSSALEFGEDCQDENFVFGLCQRLRKINVENMEVLLALIKGNYKLKSELSSGGKLHLFVRGREFTWQELEAIDNQQPKYTQQPWGYQPGDNSNQPNAQQMGMPGQQLGYNQQPWAYNQQQANYDTEYNQQPGYNSD